MGNEQDNNLPSPPESNVIGIGPSVKVPEKSTVDPEVAARARRLAEALPIVETPPSEEPKPSVSKTTW